jgi:hypothetical protein
MQKLSYFLICFSGFGLACPLFLAPGESWAVSATVFVAELLGGLYRLGRRPGGGAER